ncbi:hypothetical protein CEXT_36501 [Caerostris extrusa]|uniref:Uncharacterized protein n=1 Tax=Caerostris extrusa TaxID=172846 RepID=A0AAV4XY42_CAEEX|nr:hypothetical protein CEXT_36501 [Caerostris extrusa]
MSVWDGFSIFFQADAPGVVQQLKSVLKEGQGSSRDVYFGLAFAGTLLFSEPLPPRALEQNGFWENSCYFLVEWI